MSGEPAVMFGRLEQPDGRAYELVDPSKAEERLIVERMETS